MFYHPMCKNLRKKNIRKILDERVRMEQELAKSDQVVKLYPSDANFLLMELKDAKGFCDYAKENNVIIRDFSAKPETLNLLAPIHRYAR